MKERTEKYKLKFSKVRSNFSLYLKFGKKFGLLFVPAIVLCIAGIFSTIDKSYLPEMIAVSLFAIGLFAFYVTYRIIVAVEAVKDILRRFDAQIIFRNTETSELDLLDIDFLDDDDPTGQNFH